MLMEALRRVAAPRPHPAPFALRATFVAEGRAGKTAYLHALRTELCRDRLRLSLREKPLELQASERDHAEAGNSLRKQGLNSTAAARISVFPLHRGFSPVAEFVVNDVVGQLLTNVQRDNPRMLAAHDWLKHGALKGAHLTHANLEGANLQQAILEDARLGLTTLRRAKLFPDCRELSAELGEFLIHEILFRN